MAPEECLGEPGEFGRHPRAPFQAQRTRRAVGFTCDHQPTVSERELQRLVDIPLCLPHHVQPGDAQVCCAVFYEDRHVRWLGHDEAEPPVCSIQYQPPLFVVVFGYGVSGLFQEIHGVFGQSAFGQRYD